MGFAAVSGITVFKAVFGRELGDEYTFELACRRILMMKKQIGLVLKA